MAKVNAVEKELMEAAGLAKYTSKDRAEQLTELVEQVSNLDEDTWNGLSEGAQGWFNQAVESTNEGADMPDFPEAEAEKPSKKAAPKKAAKEEAEAEEEKPAKKPAKAKKEEAEADADAEPAEPKKRGRKPNPDKPAKEVKEKKPSGVNHIRELCVELPNAKFEEVLEKCRADGVEVADATVQAVFADTHKTLRVVRDSGKFDIYG